MTCGQTNLDDFLAEHQAANSDNNPGLYTVLSAIASSVKFISLELERAPLSGMLGASGGDNAFGDSVKKLDLRAEDILESRLHETFQVARIYSEERPVPIGGSSDGRILVCLDPLDGSSLVDFNGTTGTIFSIFQKANGRQNFSEPSCFLNLRDQACAGYGLYGPSTLLVIAFQDAVYEFTWRRDFSRKFILSGEKLRLPVTGAKVYSTNEGYSREWSESVAAHVNELKRGGHSLRYVGALVADFHRVLKQGGLFFNLRDKLRLFYEAGPLAYVIEAASGAAIAGHYPIQNILDVKAQTINAKTSLVFGSRDEVENFKNSIRP